MPFIGRFTPPGDKSVSHRVVLSALISEGAVKISGLSTCDDVASSLKIYRQLGGEVETKAGRIFLKGLGGRLNSPSAPLDCGNSGTTARLLTGILAPLKGVFTLDGDFQLRKRPMERVAQPLRMMGAKIETTTGRLPLTMEGRALKGIEYQAEAPSAQIKSAILFAALGAEGPTTYIESLPTRDHTERLLIYYGVPLEIKGRKIIVKPAKLKLPDEYDVPGDPSGAAFFLTAAAFVPGSEVTAENMLLSESRIGFLKVLSRMGAGVEIFLERENPEPVGQVKVYYNGPLKATEIMGSEIPTLVDEVPILALAATEADGVTVFHDVDELRVKEIDRLTALRHQLGALGAQVKVQDNNMLITGPTKYVFPAALDSGHDHRMSMTLTLALKALRADVPIEGQDSASISYPSFFSDLDKLWHN